MITLRRAGERRYVQYRRNDAWLTFYADARPEPRFGSLELLNELRLPPGARGATHAGQDAEIVTYVFEGTLACESAGRSSVTNAGEFQHMTVGHRTGYRESNASRGNWAHIFRIAFHLSAPIEPGYSQKRFSAAERRGVLRTVASPDGRAGSLFIHQDAVIYSSLLDRGQHLVHELFEARGAWLHVVEGEATLGAVVLSTGDGAGFAGDRAVSLTAQERTEILLVDVDLRQTSGPAGAWNAACVASGGC